MERPPAQGPPPTPIPPTQVARGPAAPVRPAARVVREPLTEEHLDGVRGWLAEIDRNLGIRSAIGLVLVALCIGAAAAAIYLAADEDEGNAASQRSVSVLREDVDDLEEQVVEAREQATEAQEAARAAQGEARSLRAQIAGLASRIAVLEAEPAPAARAGTGTAGGTGAGTAGGTGGGGVRAGD